MKHPKSRMLSQRVMAICQGWEDCNDFNELRKDPLYSLVLAGEPASQPTLSTFENSVGLKEILHFFIDRHRSQRPQRIVIDMDATEDPAHGQQELEFYHGFYGGHCFLPLLVFATADDGPMELVAAVLRPGNSHAGKRSVAVLKRIVAPLKEAFPEAEILVRADAGFALPEMYSFCEEEKIGYAISLPKNGRLGEASSSLMQEAGRKPARTLPYKQELLLCPGRTLPGHRSRSGNRLPSARSRFRQSENPALHRPETAEKTLTKDPG